MSGDVGAEVTAVLEAHIWEGGYYCSCGHELNSPRGFNHHLWDHLAPLIAERVEAAKAEALLEAADFIAATAGIGKSNNDFGRGWYGALDYTVGTLRNYPEATP